MTSDKHCPTDFASQSVIILKYDEELTRLSLGIKQLSDDPWENVSEKYAVDNVINVPVSAINDQGVFLSIEDKYEGFIPLNELTWLKKPPHPSKIIELKQNLEVKILELDNDKRRVVCSLKQLKNNPWELLTQKYKINDSFDTEVVNAVDFGIFVKVHEEIDGMVHISDLSWDENECPKILENFKKGDSVKVKILDINTDKERISLGIKQMNNDPIQEYMTSNPIKSNVSGKILEVEDKGLIVDLSPNIKGYIKRVNLSKEKSEQKTERFAVGEKVDSTIISLDSKTRLVNLSIKEIEIQEQKSALSKYGSSDSGASLGDILGSVLNKKNKD